MEPERNWWVAVVGAGPAGLYAAEALAKRGARVDVFERLFAPQGLVRYGVAPDHQKIKKTGAVFERILAQPNVSLLANVELGRDVSIDELRDNYDQVVLTVGSSGARELGVEGERLRGSVSAPAFVGWYNGHPDFLELKPPLDHHAAVVVGMGNVAIDVARVLLQDRALLARTDISHDALRELERSAIREVTLLARRGPDQAAFDLKEVRELLALADVSVRATGFRGRVNTERGELIAALPQVDGLPGGRLIHFRFCTSPRQLLGEEGRLRQIQLEANDLVESAARIRAVGNGRTETLDAGLCVSAIGYRGEPIDGVPFERASGTVPHEKGAVLTHPSGERIPRLYVAGWIKRGATGLIGTNKACAHETVETMAGLLRHMGPARAPAQLRQTLEERGVRVIDAADWKLLDQWERAEGQRREAVRSKITSLEQAIALLDAKSNGALGAQPG